MNLHLVRFDGTEKATIGKLSIDGEYHSYTMENRKLQIPEGVYPVRSRWSSKHGHDVLGIYDVPGRSDIEIHPANTPEELFGCVAPGLTHSAPDFVGNSRDAFNSLMSKFRAPCTITVESIHLDTEKPDASEALG